MPRKNRKSRKKVPQIKKDIKDFLLSEEGKISKKDVAKLGMSLAILGMMLDPNSSQAQHASHTSHSNTFFTGGQGGHQSDTAHTSTHTNHSNHGVGGWGC